LGCPTPEASLQITSLESARACYAAGATVPAIHEGVAEVFVIGWEGKRVNTQPVFAGEGAVGVAEVDGGGPQRVILFGRGVGEGKIVATARDPDGNTLTATLNVNVLAQDTPLPASRCLDSGTGGDAGAANDASPDTPDAGPSLDAGTVDAAPLGDGGSVADGG
jgi:hypothetical protein